MKTKTRRDAQLVALARLASQARLNVGDCEAHGRVVEARAWKDVLAYLQALTAFVRAHGFPVQEPLF